MLHTNSQHLTHSLITNQMNKLYFYRAIIAFITSLIGIFIPVYLYSKNFHIILILLYTIGTSLTFLIISPLTTHIINKIGLKYTLFLSSFPYLIYLYSIQYLTTSIFWYHTLWISEGIYLALFWTAFRVEIITNGNKNSRGSEMSTFQILITFVTAIAPIIGGIILEYSNYQKLFIIATTLLLLGNIPLLISKEKKLKKINFTHKDYLKIIQSKNTKQKLAHSSEGIELVLSSIIWPIIFYIFIKENFAKLGILYTTLSIITIIILIQLKKYVDKHSKKKILKTTSKLQAIGWFGRTILTLFGSIFLYVIESYAKLITNILSVTFFSIFYNNITNKNLTKILFTRTLYLHTTKILFGIGLITLLTFIDNSFSNLTMILSVGIISSFGLNFLLEEQITN